MSGTPLARPLPSNLEAERYLLGECIESPEILTAVLDAGMSEEQFTVSDHARICRALTDMRSEGIPIDICSLGEYLGADCGPLIADLTFGCVLHVSHALHHLKILEEKRQLRALLHLAEQIDTESREASASSKNIYNLIAQNLPAFLEGHVI